ncbi:MAG: hypothetical protein H0V12_02390, partial [Chloroflexi bacterium]|nr:hypothetical protein [Chloroflexota bacterium]
MSDIAATVRVSAPERARPIPAFHFGLAVLMTIVVLLGFQPYYAGLLTGSLDAHPIIHVHAAVFTGWLVLLLAQTWLVYRRRVGVHQRLGRLGIYYGFAVLAFGTLSQRALR